MTHYIWSYPTARKRHRCGFTYCRRPILPGERYGRMAGFDGGDVWTYRSCLHCIRVCERWWNPWGDDEWDDHCIAGWLQDEHPAAWSQMQAGWRYPDGELLPLPMQPRCHECGALISGGGSWCEPCDLARVELIGKQLLGIRNELAAS